MPARSKTWSCNCEECSIVGGRFFLQSEKAAHLTRVKMVRQSQVGRVIIPVVSMAAQSDPERDITELSARLASLSFGTPRAEEATVDLATQVFALTVTDEGPDIDSQPSKLWSSRDEFQAEARAPNITLPPFQDVMGSITRIVTAPSPSVSEPSHQQPQSTREPVRLPRRERNRATSKALQHLQNIELRVCAAIRQLLDPQFVDVLPDVESELICLRQAFNKITRHSTLVNDRKQQVVSILDDLEARVTTYRAFRPTIQGPLHYNSGDRNIFLLHRRYSNLHPDHHFEIPIERCDVIAQVAIFLGVICTVMMCVSRRFGDLIMGTVNLMLGLALRNRDGTYSASHSNIHAQIPSSIEQALTRFNLEGHTTTYAVCPTCHCTYKPHFEIGSDVAIYPQQCTNRLMNSPDTDVCNEPLLTARGLKQVPIKTFDYYHLFDYVAGLISRVDVEELMNNACDQLKESLQSSQPCFVKNIFEAEFLRSFEGPEPGTLFVDRGEQGRLAFALFIDFFNPEGMNIRGKHTSCGIISMACLNLPLDIRYKPENMYLGIIPGPNEPHLHELNYYLRPLVDDLKVFWDRGVRFSRTALRPSGQTSHAAVVVAVNDLPAARKMSQMAGPCSHWFCSRCHCWHRSTLRRCDFQHKDWEPRDKDKLKRAAEMWRDAPDFKTREEIFRHYGVRWSEMWRLPYWDPTQQLVVDSMHCILEGLGQFQVRKVLGLEMSSALAKPDVIPPFTYNFQIYDPTRCSRKLSEKEIGQVKLIHKILTAPLVDEDAITRLRTQLQAKNMGALQFVSCDLHLQPAGTRKSCWVDELIAWVSIH